VPDFASWQGGKAVRLGPMDSDKIPEVLRWLHDHHGGHYHWRGLHYVGFAGYQGGEFKVKPMQVGHGNVVLDVLLPDDAAAMMCWLNWA
jgi:hypothetical protein